MPIRGLAGKNDHPAQTGAGYRGEFLKVRLKSQVNST
jgi:hypothetical protein